ncbi:wax ester/triacylglycerol synthase family O-acyltransferase [Paraferrimonas sedimenticola]|uniref:diacylglycerol O-acyltransferase n=1 Tax=Paraferrimonas sedimenticola TaxID=375674 RepID=A0AA37RV11_9GAMM|nr:wax ester/triacylglycerol synthase family O-acyltransferase [Paraferrimonas sedimenticola]GLP95886.1 putative diacyglycerol O-acyltransferase tgs2 [Paraferrimonas sedimenticola]
MAKLSLLDLAFILFESNATPLHISGLVLFKPKPEQGDFAERLYQNLMSHPQVKSPFDRTVKLGLTHWPKWQRVHTVDLNYHVRRSMLPKPGNQQQLLELAARIHSYPLDRSRPLWEIWIVDGLENGDVAVLLKLHHAIADGVRATKIFTASCSEDPNDMSFVPFWNQSEAPDACEKPDQSSLLSSLFNPSLWQKQAKTSVALAKLVSRLALNAVDLAPTKLKIPFTAPRTPFNASPDKARILSLVNLPASRFVQIAKMTGTTVNDVALTISDMALQKYLRVHNWKEQKPLVALMPINIRGRTSTEEGCNKMTLGLVELGRSNQAPLKRLRTIRSSTDGIKQEALSLSPDAYYQYAIGVNAMSLLAGRLGLQGYLPPATNMLISNVPSSKKPLYLMGARLSEMYPISLLLPGQSLNITVLSYAGDLHFGLVCCRRSLPGFETISDYLIQALDDLEEAAMTHLSQVLLEQMYPQEEEPQAPTQQYH